MDHCVCGCKRVWQNIGSLGDKKHDYLDKRDCDLKEMAEIGRDSLESEK